MPTGRLYLSVYEPSRRDTHRFSYGSAPPRSRGTPSLRVPSPQIGFEWNVLMPIPATVLPPSATRRTESEWRVASG